MHLLYQIHAPRPLVLTQITIELLFAKVNTCNVSL